MEIKIFQLPKREAHSYDQIQDKYAVKGDCIAIADGATQSFKPDLWADLLVRKYSARPALTKESFRSMVIEAGSEFNLKKFTLSVDPLIALLEKKSFTRGGYAAFLGATVDKERREVNFISYGDCLIVVSENNRLRFYPFKDLEELRSSKSFLPSTNFADNFEDAAVNVGTISFIDDTRLYFMTDAIGAYLLRHHDAINEISSWTSFDEFKDHVHKKWDCCEIEEDDITLVSLDPAKPAGIIEYVPHEINTSLADGDVRSDRIPQDSVAVSSLSDENNRAEARSARPGLSRRGRLGLALVFLIAGIIAVVCAGYFSHNMKAHPENVKIKILSGHRSRALE